MALSRQFYAKVDPDKRAGHEASKLGKAWVNGMSILPPMADERQPEAVKLRSLVPSIAGVGSV